MSIKEVVESLQLQTYEYCNKKKIIKSIDSSGQVAKLSEIARLTAALDDERVTYTIDTDSNFIELFDHKL